MNDFRTPIASDFAGLLDTSKPFVSLGSCFADSIGQRLLMNKWQGLSNPFGNLFHPYAIFNVLAPPARLPERLFIEGKGLVHHHWLPKTFFATSRADFIRAWSERKELLGESLRQAKSVLLLTLGTSQIFTRDGAWVANCHQQPAHLFQKSHAAIADMLSAWDKARAQLPEDCSIIVTVSPVRHLKEGLIDNSLSKSQLRVLAHEMVKSDPRRVRYFPAFEIMMDDLRDYRFYQPDMLHPSDQAVAYIWDKFQEIFMDEPAKAFIREWQKILARLQHRPLHPQSEDYKSFLLKLSRDLRKYHGFAVQNELDSVDAKLALFA